MSLTYRIVRIGAAVIFIAPIIYSLLYIVKLVFVDWRDKKKDISYFALMVLIFLLVMMASFLIYFIVAKFVFAYKGLPYYLNAIGLILFMLYNGVFFCLVHGLGSLGHGGVAPRMVLLELYKLIIKREK